MPPSPEITFFIHHDRQPAGAGHPLWNAPLPAGPRPLPSAGPRTTYADCFEAAASYLAADGFAPIREAVAGDPRSVSIRLEKHGAFYHPAHVTVETSAGTAHLALNTALSSAGRALMDREVAVLRRLTHGPVRDDVPRVYHAGMAETRGGAEVRLFLAEWFEGFCEFHLSTADPESGRQGVVVWDPEAGRRFLSPGAAAEVFRGAARILSRAYDPGSAEHIRSWHHAAGDFVVRQDGDGMRVKLITVREYAAGPLPAFGETDPAAAGLLKRLLFFLELGLRMRLDRLDGTGGWAWADRACLSGAVRGFFEGLSGAADEFRSWARGFDRETLATILSALVDTFHPDMPELPLVRERLTAHAEDLEAVLSDGG